MARFLLASMLLSSIAPVLCAQQDAPQTMPMPNLGWRPGLVSFFRGEFSWTATDALIGPADRPDDPCHAVKDPTVVRYDGRWHLFYTIRTENRSHQIEYMSFADWPGAAQAERHILTLTGGRVASPQVFYFTPRKKWFLICQIDDPSGRNVQPAYCTSDDTADPRRWSKPAPLLGRRPAEVRLWGDFWVICAGPEAHLFFTSPDGCVWRCETSVDDFPSGFGRPVVALEADIGAAARIYHLRSLRRYLAVAEAHDGGRRFLKAFLTTRLDGDWSELADTVAKPFAGRANVSFPGPEPWADSIGHGELIRLGHDEKMEVAWSELSMVFSGCAEADRGGKPYGQTRWRIGLLRTSH